MIRKSLQSLCLLALLFFLTGRDNLPVTAQTPSSPPVAHYYIADSDHNCLLQMDDITGRHSVTMGTLGTGNNMFRNPTRLFVDTKGHIYVCDTDNHRIVRMDDITGKNWMTSGSRGHGEQQFQFPVSIHVDPNGRLTILDLGNTRIVQMDDMTGKNWRTLAIPGISIRYGDPHKARENEELQHLTEWHLPNVVVDTKGRLYYPDQKNRRVTRVDDITGKNPVMLGPPGKNESDLGQFLVPQMLGLDSMDRLYVLSVPGYLARVDDMTGKNWTTLYAPVPGIAAFYIVGLNSLCATPFSGNIENRTQTLDGKVVFTRWKQPFTDWVDIFAR